MVHGTPLPEKYVWQYERHPRLVASKRNRLCRICDPARVRSLALAREFAGLVTVVLLRYRSMQISYEHIFSPSQR